MELTDELQLVDGAELLPVLNGVLGSAWSPETSASLALAYERKGYEVRSSVWPEYGAGNRDSCSQDSYVLTVQIRVPKDFVQLDFTEMLGDSIQALRKKTADELEAERVALQSDMDRVQSAIADLGQR